MKKIGLRKMVLSLQANFLNHVGSNSQTAHLPATQITNGFMTKDHVAQLNQSLGKRKYLTGSNLLELAPGFYEVVDPQNGPLAEAGIYEIDVTVQGSRKQIRAMQSYSGRIWFYNEHTNNAVVLGWREVEQKIEIFNVYDAEMSSTPVGTTFEIKTPFKLQNFRRFEFDVNFGMRDVTLGSGYVGNNLTVELQNSNIKDTGLSIFMYEMSLKRTSDTRFYCERNITRAIYANGSGSSTTDTENEIKLTKIRGIL